MSTCIYCLRALPEDRFNREHVIPQQLGSFENCPILRTVCSECNSYFANSLELKFGRDSIEAVYRLRHRQKRPEEFDGFKGDRLKFTVPSNLAAGGIVLEPAASPDGSEIVMLLPPQVGVKREGETEFRYHTEEELTGESIDLLPPANEKVKIRLLAADDAGVERIRELVLARFPKFREEGKLDLPPPDRIDGKMIVEIKSKVDRLLVRAIAKIAFNYMAFHAGAKFALSPSFDPVRRFIRYDQGGDDWREFVRILSKPLLAEETEDLQVTRGHILILGWRDFETLAVWVSPYNSMAYEVTLTRSYRGVWTPLKIGQVFDWEHHSIVPLVHPGRIILPLWFASRAARAYQALVRRPLL
jgi:HNH endonuclease